MRAIFNGAHRDHAVGNRVHQPEGLVGHGDARPVEQARFELDQGRLDPVVAMVSEDRHQAFDRIRLDTRIGRQDVAQAVRQQRRVHRFVHHAQIAGLGAPGNGKRYAAVAGPWRRAWSATQARSRQMPNDNAKGSASIRL
jgi:hypothetical protein